MYLIKNNKLSIIVHAILVQAILVQAIINNKLSILNNKLSILSNKLISSSKKLVIISNKLSIIVHDILVQAILVQRYSCAPNILYYINHSIIFCDPWVKKTEHGDMHGQEQGSSTKARPRIFQSLDRI